MKWKKKKGKSCSNHNKKKGGDKLLQIKCLTHCSLNQNRIGLLLKYLNVDLYWNFQFGCEVSVWFHFVY